MSARLAQAVPVSVSVSVSASVAGPGSEHASLALLRPASPRLLTPTAARLPLSVWPPRSAARELEPLLSDMAFHSATIASAFSQSMASSAAVLPVGPPPPAVRPAPKGPPGPLLERLSISSRLRWWAKRSSFSSSSLSTPTSDWPLAAACRWLRPSHSGGDCADMVFLRDLALGWLLSTAYSMLDITNGGATPTSVWSRSVIQWITADAKRTVTPKRQVLVFDLCATTAGNSQRLTVTSTAQHTDPHGLTVDHGKDRGIPGYSHQSWLWGPRCGAVTDTIAAATRKHSPTKNRIAVRRSIGFGAGRRRKNQSGGLSAKSAVWWEPSIKYPLRDAYSRGVSQIATKDRP